MKNGPREIAAAKVLNTQMETFPSENARIALTVSSILDLNIGVSLNLKQAQSAPPGMAHVLGHLTGDVCP